MGRNITCTPARLTIDAAVVANREIRLQHLYLEANATMFTPDTFPRLRDPMDFANHSWRAKLRAQWREQLAQGMLYWQSTPIPTSLTLVSSAHISDAVQMFRT